jgi:hypothetical protein
LDAMFGGRACCTCGREDQEAFAMDELDLHVSPEDVGTNTIATTLSTFMLAAITGCIKTEQMKVLCV